MTAWTRVFGQLTKLVLVLTACLVGSASMSVAVHAQEDGQELADRIASFSAKAIYNLDEDQLKAVLEGFLHDQANIRAVQITESIDDELIMSYFRDGDRAVFGEAIPESLLSFDRFSASSIVDGETVGTIDIYYEHVDVSSLAPDDKIIELSAEERAWIESNPTIRVSNESDWPPFNFAVDGNPQGYSVDYINLLARKTGLEIEFTTGPSWADYLEMMKSGDLDVMLNIVKTPDRLKYLLFTPPYANNPNTILSRNDAPFQSIEDLYGKTVSVPKGFFYEEILKRDFPQITVMTTDSVLESMKAVGFGTSDAAFGELAIFQHLINEHLFTDLYVSGEVKLGDPEFALLNIATRMELPELHSILSKAIRAVKPSEKRVIQEKWFPTAGAVARQVQLNLTVAEQDWIENHPVIRIGVDPSYPPFEFIDDDGQYRGMAPEYLELMGEHLGIEFKVVPGLTWPEVLEGLKNGTIDVAPVVHDNQERRAFLNFTRPYLVYPDAIYTRTDHPPISGLAELSGKSIAMPAGYSNTQLIRQSYPGIEVIEVANLAEALRSVAAGESDATVGNTAVVGYIARQHNITDIKVATQVELGHGAFLSMGVSKDWPELVGILQKAFDSISTAERLEIARRWIASTETTQQATAPEQEQATESVFWFLALIVGLMLSLSVIGFFLSRSMKEQDLSTYFGAPGFRIAVMVGLSVFVTAVVLMNWVAIGDSKKRTVRAVSNELQLVLHSSVESLNRWVEERQAFLHQLGRDPKLVNLVKSLLAVDRERNALLQSEALANAREFFIFNEQFGSAGFFIISPDNISIGSSRDANIGTPNFVARLRPDLIERAFAGEAVFIPPIRSDVAIGEDGVGESEKKPLNMFFAAPIADENGFVLAVLTERILPKGPLSKILRLGQVGSSGETYAFNADAKMVSESRFVDEIMELDSFKSETNSSAELFVRDPGVDLTAGNEPAFSPDKWPITRMVEDALLMRERGTGVQSRSEYPTNTEGYRDYRGVSVVGAWTWLRDIDIGLATEMDASEAMAIHAAMRTNLIVISAIATILAVGTTLFTLMVGQRSHRSLSLARDELEERVFERTQELQDSETRIHTIINNAADGIIVMGEKGVVHSFNPAAERIFGYSADEVIGKNIKMLMPEPTQGEHDGYLERYMRTREARIVGTSREVAGLRKDGTTFPMDLAIGEAVLDSEHIFTGMIRDITDRKKVEEERQKADEKLSDAYRIISSSINYASNIQKSLLPHEGLFEETFADYFLIWEPRDVVGGDMYWLKKDRHGYFVALFDCTGHGVPGALMTTLTISALNTAFAETADPARLLSKVNQIIKDVLGQNGGKGDSDDGLEMGICFVETERMRATFAGARFDLFIEQKDSIEVVKGDKGGLGYRHVLYDHRFNNRSLRLQKSQRFYMCSDGVIDQVGGEKRRSFGRKRMISILEQKMRMPMRDQGEAIIEALTEYQGSEVRRDDVSMIGFMPLR